MPMELCSIAQNQLVKNQHQIARGNKKILYPSIRIQKTACFIKEMIQSER
jgi:hypothetical protein